VFLGGKEFDLAGETSLRTPIRLAPRLYNWQTENANTLAYRKWESMTKKKFVSSTADIENNLQP
jgi:hypothetical protein